MKSTQSLRMLSGIGGAPRNSERIGFVVLMVLASWTSASIPIAGTRSTLYDFALIAALAIVLPAFQRVARPIAWSFVGCMFVLEVATLYGLSSRSINSLAGVAIGILSFQMGTVLALRTSAQTATVAIATTAVLNFVAAGSQTVTRFRGNGLARFPNELGTTAIGLALTSAALLLVMRSRKYRMVLYAVLLIAVWLSLQSGGRSATLSVALTILLLFAVQTIDVRSGRMQLRWLVVAGFGVIIASQTGLQEIVATTPVGQRTANRLPETGILPAFFRENWENGIKLFLDSPLVGSSWADLDVPSAILGGTFTVHNTFLAVPAATGLVGCVLLLLALRTALRARLWPLLNRRVLLLGLVPHLLFHNLLNSRSFWLSLGVFVGLALRPRNDTERLQPDRSPSSEQRRRGTLIEELDQ